jgi:hypothetical protein
LLIPNVFFCTGVDDSCPLSRLIGLVSFLTELDNLDRGFEFILTVNG